MTRRAASWLTMLLAGVVAPARRSAPVRGRAVRHGRTVPRAGRGARRRRRGGRFRLRAGAAVLAGQCARLDGARSHRDAPRPARRPASLGAPRAGRRFHHHRRAARSGAMLRDAGSCRFGGEICAALVDRSAGRRVPVPRMVDGRARGPRCGPGRGGAADGPRRASAPTRWGSNWRSCSNNAGKSPPRRASGSAWSATRRNCATGAAGQLAQVAPGQRSIVQQTLRCGFVARSAPVAGIGGPDVGQSRRRGPAGAGGAPRRRPRRGVAAQLGDRRAARAPRPCGTADPGCGIGAHGAARTRVPRRCGPGLRPPAPTPTPVTSATRGDCSINPRRPATRRRRWREQEIDRAARRPRRRREGRRRRTAAGATDAAARTGSARRRSPAASPWRGPASGNFDRAEALVQHDSSTAGLDLRGWLRSLSRRPGRRHGVVQGRGAVR